MSEGKSPFEEEEEHENAERWLLTYADMITLLVAFFILLYSMSVLNIAKFQKLALSVRSGFNGPLKSSGGMSIVEKGQVSTLEHPAASTQLDTPAKFLAPLALLKPGHNGPLATPREGSGPVQAKEALIQAKAAAAQARDILVHTLGPGAEVKVTQTPHGFTVELAGDEIFFSEDSAELSEAAKQALLALAPILAASSLVGVEGFSGSSATGGFGLSSQRALTVLAVLQEGGVADSKLSATGFGVRAPGGLGGRDYVRITLKR